MALRMTPAGLWRADLAVALRVRSYSLTHALGRAVAARYIQVDENDVFTLGPVVCPPFLPARRYGAQRDDGMGLERDAVLRQHRGSLREFIHTGMSIHTGDPLRELADLQDAARAVLAAKALSRFKGAEVDVAVARELRSITAAMSQATSNLKRYLEVMGT
jgi:hypothetical protein